MTNIRFNELSQSQYVILIWTLFAVGTLFTFLRLLIRWLAQHHFHLDDYLAFLTWLFLLLVATLDTTTASSTFLISTQSQSISTDEFESVPSTTIDETHYAHEYKKNSIAQMAVLMFFWGGLWAAKFSIMAFFRRLMRGIQGYMVYWWVVFGVAGGTFLGCVLSNVLACLPVERRWSVIPSESCIATEKGMNAVLVAIKYASAVDIGTDALIMLLPIPLLRGLRISHAQKLSLIIIFSLGTIVIVVSVLRLNSITDSISEKNLSANQDLAVWSMIEATVACVVISLPPMRSLLRGNILGTSSGGQNIGGAGIGGTGSTNNLYHDTNKDLNHHHHHHHHNHKHKHTTSLGHESTFRKFPPRRIYPLPDDISSYAPSPMPTIILQDLQLGPTSPRSFRSNDGSSTAGSSSTHVATSPTISDPDQFRVSQREAQEMAVGRKYRGFNFENNSSNNSSNVGVLGQNIRNNNVNHNHTVINANTNPTHMHTSTSRPRSPHTRTPTHASLGGISLTTEVRVTSIPISCHYAAHDGISNGHDNTYNHEDSNTYVEEFGRGVPRSGITSMSSSFMVSRNSEIGVARGERSLRSSFRSSVRSSVRFGGGGG
ncbi:hypothetical protein DFH27DRAFT_651237 [Peziza echinospora]|nr:hypothetical protein DFH27DRAFT_651237 [Peziza echinospora]